MTPLQTYKDMMSEFKKKFLKKKICKCCLKEKCDYSTTGCPWYQDNLVLNENGGEVNTAEQMKSHIHTSFIKFLESEIEHWKGERKKMKETHICRFNDGEQNCECYLSAISKVIEHYEQLIEEIKN